jgi:ribonuclease HI
MKSFRVHQGKGHHEAMITVEGEGTYHATARTHNQAVRKLVGMMEKDIKKHKKMADRLDIVADRVWKKIIYA